jgi:hypothetical protein
MINEMKIETIKLLFALFILLPGSISPAKRLLIEGNS